MIFARREDARREEDGPVSSRGRGHRGVSCGGKYLPAGAGLLTWWRRRARRTPVRKGAACRPPGVGAVPADPLGVGMVPAPARTIVSVASRFRVRTRPGPDGLARLEGVPLKP